MTLFLAGLAVGMVLMLAAGSYTVRALVDGIVFLLRPTSEALFARDQLDEQFTETARAMYEAVVEESGK
jgi:hypothetical protein